MSTQKQVERQKRSVLHQLARHGRAGAAKYFVLAGFSQYGRAVRLAAISELLTEHRIEQHGCILRIKSGV